MTHVTPMSKTILLPLLLTLHAAADAQTWQITATANPGPFVTLELGADPAGPLAYDPQTNNTFALFGSGTVWNLVNSATGLGPLLTAMTRDGAVSHRFGGLDQSSGLFSNTLSRFDRAPGTWTVVPLLPGFPSQPSPRMQSAAAAPNDSNLVIVFGGWSGVSALQDTWKMQEFFGQAVWAQVPTTTQPPPRHSHSMARGPGNSVVLVGGFGTGGTLLSDTWIFSTSTNSWTQFTGTGPASAGTMAYDRSRDMTVLVRSNGEHWEWNGFAWRQVVLLSPPVLQPLVQIAFDRAPGFAPVMRGIQITTTGVDTLAFTPSIATFDSTLDSNCFANFSLAAFQRSLPALGQTLHTQLTGAPATGVLFIDVEPATGFSNPSGICGCMLGVMLVQTLFVPNVAGVGDFLLTIPNNTLFVGTALDMQGFVLDSTIPCQAASSNRCTAVIGG
jgi:hypothetical protein